MVVWLFVSVPFCQLTQNWFKLSHFEIENEWFQIQIQKDQNQNFEQEFKICERNKTKIVHHQNEEKMDKIIILAFFMTVAF
jgi:hypothetical protein